MEMVGNYIPVVLIVLAILAANWRTTTQYGDLAMKYGHIMANMATKEDIQDMKNEVKDMKNDVKALDDRINRFETHVNQQFAEIRGEINSLKRDVNTLQQSYINHLITEHNVRPMQPSEQA